MKRVFISISKAIRSLREKPLIRDTISTTFLSIIGKGVGFLIPFFVAAWFGVSGETDAFFFAFALILFLANIFSPAVENVIVPFIASAQADNEDVGEFLGKIMGVSALWLSILAALFLVLSKPLLALLTKFSPEGLDLIQTILIETAPMVVLLVWTAILSGTFNAYKIFSIPALSPAFRAVVTISFIFALKDVIGIHAIALGYVTGEIVRLCILLLLLKRLRLFRIKFSLKWEKKFSHFFKTSSYHVIGMSVLAFTPIINQAMASWLGTGNVSLLEYANRLYMIPSTLIASGLMIPVLSHWSADYQTGGEKSLKKNVFKAMKVIAPVMLLMTISLFLAKDLLVGIVYGYGKFPKEQMHEVASIFGLLLLGITPFSVSMLYSRAFLTQKNTKVFLISDLVTVTGTVVLNLILMQAMGIKGLALSASIVTLLSLIILSFIFHRQRPQVR